MLLFLTLLAFSVEGQEKQIRIDSLKENYDMGRSMIIDGDTIPIFELQEITLFDRPRFKDMGDRRKYYILKRKVLKVWPYAMQASIYLNQTEDRIKDLSRRKGKKYVKNVQRYLEEEFKETLKGFTTTEGQILVKLVYRQTGRSTYSIIKDLKSGWKAFWWNSTASFFDISLKRTYDPENVVEDKLIENILQRAFAEGRLEYQKAHDEQHIGDFDKWLP